jgi:hypothetical protein
MNRLGGMRVLNELFQQRHTYRGEEVVFDAIACLVDQYFDFQSKGYVFTHPEPAINRFLSRQPASMSHELTRLLEGGLATVDALAGSLTALTLAVWSNRYLLSNGGQRAADALH